MRREACALWITPFDAALEMARTAALSSDFVRAASPAVSASRNLRTWVRTAEVMAWLRARCRIAWRFCFSADLVLATFRRSDPIERGRSDSTAQVKVSIAEVAHGPSGRPHVVHEPEIRDSWASRDPVGGEGGGRTRPGKRAELRPFSRLFAPGCEEAFASLGGP